MLWDWPERSVRPGAKTHSFFVAGPRDDVPWCWPPSNESFSIPIIILITVPLALAGSVARSGWGRGLFLDIYARSECWSSVESAERNRILMLNLPINVCQEAMALREKRSKRPAISACGPIVLTALPHCHWRVFCLVFARVRRLASRLSIGTGGVRLLGHGTHLFVVPVVYLEMKLWKAGMVAKRGPSPSESGNSNSRQIRRITDLGQGEQIRHIEYMGGRGFCCPKGARLVGPQGSQAGRETWHTQRGEPWNLEPARKTGTDSLGRQGAILFQ